MMIQNMEFLEILAEPRYMASAMLVLVRCWCHDMTVTLVLQEMAQATWFNRQFIARTTDRE